MAKTKTVSTFRKKLRKAYIKAKKAPVLRGSGPGGSGGGGGM